MTTGCYKGLGRDTLIQMRTDTLSEIETLRKGKRISSASMSGKSSSKSLMTTNELRDELKEIDYALRSLPSTDLEPGDIASPSPASRGGVKTGRDRFSISRLQNEPFLVVRPSGSRLPPCTASTSS